MLLLFLSPLIFLGLHMLAIIDLRYETGREREFLRLTTTAMLVIVFFGLSLIWVSPEHPLNWKSGLSLLIAAIFYAKAGIDLLVRRKSDLAPIRLHLALSVWALSIAVYAMLYIF